MSGARTLGITVMPEWIQVEGTARLLDNLARAGATAVATSPYVMTPAPEGEGGREPPIDAGAGRVRLLERSLWGRRELWATTAPSFVPDPVLYDGLRYQPAAADELTHREGPKVHAFIKTAKARGREVFLQVQAAIPPGYRVQFGGPVEDDLPRLPDGSLPTGRVDKNGSLASPHVRAYLRALLQDLARAYPEIDGFRIDWPEYPVYSFDSLFLDFSPHAVGAAARLGFDIERIHADTLALMRLLQALDDEALLAVLSPGGGRYDLLRLLARFPGVLELLRFKAALVADFLRATRDALPHGKRLVPQAFPPPWSLLTGFDCRQAAAFADGIAIKLYTMHWPMMLHGYAQALLERAPGLDRGLVASALVALLDTGGPQPSGLDDLSYPEPEKPHPAGDEAMARKIRAARVEAGERPVYALAHAYGPLADVERRIRVAWGNSPDGVWINRYGYLGDAKLDALGRIASGR